MTTSKVWSIEVTLEEDSETTQASAVLQLWDRQFHGWGRARRNPADPARPRIGEELATARALSDLSHHLLHAAAEAIEEFESEKAGIGS